MRSKILELACTDPTVWMWIRSPSFYHLTENHLQATAALAWILGGQCDSVFPGEQTLAALLGWGGAVGGMSAHFCVHRASLGGWEDMEQPAACIQASFTSSNAQFI